MLKEKLGCSRGLCGKVVSSMISLIHLYNLVLFIHAGSSNIFSEGLPNQTLEVAVFQNPRVHLCNRVFLCFSHQH